MKANEFIKKHGISAASELVNESEWSIKQLALATTTSMLDLKRLVESHALVESKGGLIKAKEILADNPVWCSGSKRYSSPLERAIADVESCMEVKSEN